MNDEHINAFAKAAYDAGRNGPGSLSFDAARAMLIEDARDAARYRWIRNQNESLYYLFDGATENMGFVDLATFPQWDDLDKAVDAAMRGEAELAKPE